MTGLGLAAQAGIFAASAALSLLLVPRALRLALRRELLDEPGGHKGHASPVPYLGGTAIVAAFVVTLGVAAAARPPVARLEELLVILALGAGLCLVGLVDDLRGLPVGVRLAAITAAGLGLWAVGIHVRLGDVGPLNLLVTLAWVVGVTNAFNLLDNMDGLSAGVAVIAAGWFFVIAVLNGQFLVAALTAALAGCALGFLRHNAHPARIYMGDAGSLFLGFTLAVVGIKLRFAAPWQVTALVPIVVLGLPLTDTALVVVERLRHRRSPFVGGRDHLSHRLVALGLSVPTAVRCLYAAALLLGWAGLVVSRLDAVTAYLLVGLIAAGLGIGALLLARIPVYAESTHRQVRLVVSDHEPPPPPAATGRPDPAPR